MCGNFLRDTPHPYCITPRACYSVTDMATDILTTRAVAARFGVAISTVTRWVADGHLQPFHKTPGLRGQFLFTADEVERFAKDRAA